MDKLVSIIVASYNTGKYLPYAINSALDQTYTNYEVILVDDGSTDGTNEIAKQWMGNNRFKYVYQENKGLAGARNTALEYSQGEYIAILDADDCYTRDKLDKQMPCFDISSSIGVVYTNFSLQNEHGEIRGSPKRRYYSGRVTDKLLIDNFVNGPGAIIKRECFDKLGTYDESLRTGEDYDLWLRLSTQYDFYFLDEITYYYRVWDGQMTRNYRRMIDNGIHIMHKFLNDYPGFLDKKTIDEAWARTYVGRGTCLMRYENDRRNSLLDVMRALHHKPTYLPAWKMLVKMAINRKI